ncbi:MAG: hypothetical protein HY841_13590 [Bacteroidetes bacterium]|nr:hypothetical protein [Bacteroidota bacterium]
MNKKTLLIIAAILFIAGGVSMGFGIFWQLSVSETEDRWNHHHEMVGELLKKTEIAQASQDPKAQELLKELEKENRYVKYADKDKENQQGERNLYLGIGLPLLIISVFLFLKSKKRTIA